MCQPPEALCGGISKVNFQETLSSFGDKCPQNGSKTGQERAWDTPTKGLLGVTVLRPMRRAVRRPSGRGRLATACIISTAAIAHSPCMQGAGVWGSGHGFGVKGLGFEGEGVGCGGCHQHCHQRPLALHEGCWGLGSGLGLRALSVGVRV